MNSTSLFLITLCQSFVHLSADKHDALVINRFNSSLYEIPRDIDPETQCGNWASACPAKDKYDEKFISETAITENALFVEKTCQRELSVGEADFKTEICDNPFQISAVFNKKTIAFEFGYEIYYPIENENIFHTHYRRKKYINTERVFKSFKEKSKLTQMLFKEYMKLILMEKKHHWHGKNKKLRFMWISLFIIEFNFYNWTPKRIVYQIRSNNKWPVAFSCEKYDLVTEAYKGVDLDKLYSAENQSKIFSDLVLPEESSAAGCKPNCLEKWLLIPVDQFHFGTLDYSLCSNMATVPIWTSTIRKVLMKVEKFLYALYLASKGGLYISSGISGQLELTKTEIKWKIIENPKKPVYLDTERKKIPVPEILYKVVKYKPKRCPKDRICLYSVTIIIHNDPNFNKTTDKICEDMTSAWAWIDVTVEKVPNSEISDPSPYIYVCKTDLPLLKRLMGFSAMGEPREMKDLKLNDFPFYDAEKNLVSKQILKDIRYPMAELNSREKELKLKHGIEEGRESTRESLRLLSNLIPTQSKPLDRIMEDDNEDDTEGIVEIDDSAQRNIIDRPQGDLEAVAVADSLLAKELNQQIKNESKDNGDEDTSSDEEQETLTKNADDHERLLHTVPEFGSDEKSIKEGGESDNDEISDSDSQERFDTAVGSEDEGKSSPNRGITAGSTSSNLDEQYSPKRRQSLDKEEMSTAHHDLKHEDKSDPEDGTNPATSSNVEKHSSPGK